jgi:Ricin-type beta-trefoil lectin domain-like
MSSTKLFLRIGTGLAVPAACATALLIPAGAALAADAPAADTSQPTGQVWIMSNQNSGLVADDPGLSTEPGTSVDQWGYNAGDNQSWVITADSGAFTIASRYNGLCLTATSGNPSEPVVQDTCDGGDSQQWQLTWTGPMNNGNRDARLQNEMTGEYLAIESDSTSQGASLDVEPSSTDPAANWTLGLTGYHFLTTSFGVPQEYGDPAANSWDDTPTDGYTCQPDYHFRMSSGSTPVYQSTGTALVAGVVVWAEPVVQEFGWVELDPTDADAGLGHLNVDYTESGDSATTGQIQVYCDVNSGVDS